MNQNSTETILKNVSYKYGIKGINNLVDNQIEGTLIRVEEDYREEKLGYKIRESQTAKIPYTLVIGDNEVANNQVTYRKHGTQAQVTVSVEEFVNLILEHNKNNN